MDFLIRIEDYLESNCIYEDMKGKIFFWELKYLNFATPESKFSDLQQLRGIFNLLNPIVK